MEAAAGRANVSRFFSHVLKGASLRVARSDWTAARVLFFEARAVGDAMVASHELRFALSRMLASLFEATDG
jgi:hypothetical protein